MEVQYLFKWPLWYKAHNVQEGLYLEQLDEDIPPLIGGYFTLYALSLPRANPVLTAGM